MTDFLLSASAEMERYDATALNISASELATRSTLSRFYAALEWIDQLPNSTAVSMLIAFMVLIAIVSGFDWLRGRRS